MGDCGAWLQAVNKAIIPVHKQEERVKLISWCIFCLLYYTIGKGKLPI